MTEENPLKSIEVCIAFHPGDWSDHHREAWIYGIVLGWGEALESVAKKHDWNSEQVARLQRLHKAYQELKEMYERTKNRDGQ